MITPQDRARLERISLYLKTRWPNLSVLEIQSIAFDLMEIMADGDK